MKTPSLLLSIFLVLSSNLMAFEPRSNGLNPLELHQAYMSGKEKISQHRFMLWQQFLKHLGDAVQIGLIGVGTGCAYKVYVNHEPESLISSPWAFRAGCAAVALLVVKELYGIIAFDRAGFAQLAAMEKDIDAEYEKQVRYFLLGENDGEEPVEQPIATEPELEVAEEVTVEAPENDEKNNI
jgi:hypothetical protein